MGMGTQSYVGESGLSNALSNPTALFVGAMGGLGLPLRGPFRCQIPVRLGIADEAVADWASRRVEVCSATSANSATATAPSAIALPLDLMDPFFAFANAPEPRPHVPTLS